MLACALVQLGTNSVMCRTVRQNNIFMIYDIKVGFSCIIDADMLLDYFQQPLKLRMVWVNTLMVAFSQWKTSQHRLNVLAPK